MPSDTPPSVLLVAAEAVPYAKTGGLGDVISPLAESLQRRGLHVTLMLPGYPGALRQAGALEEVAALDDLPGGPGRLLRVAGRRGVRVLLLATERFARHEGPYVDDLGREHADNPVRFADLAHAAERVCSGRTPLPAPGLVHLHDWHTALLPLIQHARGGALTPSVLTIHNLAFQGACSMDEAARLGLGADASWRERGEFWGRFNPLKTGIALAGKITTVSRSYADEIMTPRFGCGLEGALGERAADVIGVANGIDVACWTPDTDRLLPANFSAGSLAGKAACKRALQRAFGLPQQPLAPLLALGSRLTHQKMADVALAALPRALASHPELTVAVLGRGEAQYEQRLRRLAAAHPGRIAAHVGYDEVLAHLLHGGADLLLHGSRFEPFGLTPLYAMRYGTLPIASRVGGIRDTIIDVGDLRMPCPQASGVLFDGESADEMLAAISRGLAVHGDTVLRRRLQRNGMTADFGWERQAEAFVELYRGVVSDDCRPLFDALFADPACEPSEAWEHEGETLVATA